MTSIFVPFTTRPLIEAFFFPLPNVDIELTGLDDDADANADAQIDKGPLNKAGNTLNGQRRLHLRRILSSPEMGDSFPNTAPTDWKRRFYT